MKHLGNLTEDQIIDFTFSTHSADGTPTSLAGTPAISVYKANSTTQTTEGVTLTVDFDSVTGLNHVRIDTSAHAFYATGNDYSVIITTGTVDGTSVVGTTLAVFSIENRYVEETPQTGDSYAIVNHADYGNAKLVRSETPANKLSLDADGCAAANVLKLNDAFTDGTPDMTERPELHLKNIRIYNPSGVGLEINGSEYGAVIASSGDSALLLFNALGYALELFSDGAEIYLGAEISGADLAYLINGWNTGGGLKAALDATKTAVEAVDTLTEAGGDGDLAAIKTQTDKFSFTGTDVKATLDGEAVNVTKWGGTAVGSVVLPSNMTQINGTSIAGTSTQVAAAFLAQYNVASPVFTNESVNQSGDAYSPVQYALTAATAAKTAAEAVETIVEPDGPGDLAAIKTQTDKLSFTGTDVKATLDGEEVTPTTASKTGYSLTAAYDAAKTAGTSTLDAAGVRAELSTELGRIDAAISSRHAAGAAVAKSPATLNWSADVSNPPTIPAIADIRNTSLYTGAFTADVLANAPGGLTGDQAAQLAAIKTQTDKFSFTGTDVKATLDGEEVTPTTASKTGYALTSEERTAIAAAIEADLIDDETHQAVMAAILAKLEAGFPDLDTLTLTAIASQVRTELATELARIDATISSRHAAGAAVAKSPATLDWSADVSNPPTIPTIADIRNTSLYTGAFTADVLANAPAGGEGSGGLTDDQAAQLAAIKTQTDKFSFTGTDVKATLDGEEVTPTTASKTGYSLTVDYDAAKTAGTSTLDAAGVRTELSTELARIDATISSRHAAGAAVAKSPATLDWSADVSNPPTIGDATAANQTTMLNRIGAFTGTGINTILGFFKALLSKTADTPSDIGGDFLASTDSVEAIRDTAPLGTAMRGTDGAALATYFTESRASRLDNIPDNKPVVSVDGKTLVDITIDVEDLAVIVDELEREGGMLDTISTYVTGGGDTLVTITCAPDDVPMEGVKVWITYDSAGTALVANPIYTNTLGQCVFMLNAGTYYVWRQKVGVRFTDPQTITV